MAANHSHSFWRKLWSAFTRSKARPIRREPLIRWRRLEFESLEQRVLLNATILWNGVDSNNWFDTKNWSNPDGTAANRVPGASDVVSISVIAGAAVFNNPTINSATTIQSLTTADPISLTAGNFQIGSGGLTFSQNTTFTITGGADLLFGGASAEAISGTGQILFGDGNGNNLIGLNSNITLTIGANVTIHGKTGTVGRAVFNGGNQSIVNNGAISADAGGTITVNLNQGGTLANAGTIAAQNGGALLLDSPVSGGTITSDNVSATSVEQNGTTITGSTISVQGNGLLVTGSNSNVLDNVTVNGNLNMAGGGHEAVVGTLTQDGTTSIGGGGLLYFLGPQAALTGTSLGNAVISFADGNGSNAVSMDGNVAVTFSATVEIHGNTGSVGQSVFNGGNQSIADGGAISADDGGAITVNLNQGGTLTNSGAFAAQNGGKLLLDSPIAITTATFTSDGTSSLVQNGTSITGGNLTINGSGMVVSGSNSNSLNNVTITGNLNLSNGGHEAVTGTLTQNGTTSIGGGVLFFVGPQATLTGTSLGNAVITFADGNGSNQVALDGAVKLTISATAEIDGITGTVGQGIFNGGTQSITNNGAISGSGAGGTVSINLNNGGTLTNTGTLEAQNGGTLLLDSPISGGTITSDNAAGSTVKQNGTTITGSTISVQGAGMVVTGSNANELNNVTVNGNLNLAGGGHDAVVGTLTQNGTTSIAAGGLLFFLGPQAAVTGTAAGDAFITFADGNGSNAIALDGNVALTLSSTVVIDGNTGSVGVSEFNGGNQSITSNGAIRADAGGTVNVNLNQGGTLTDGGAFTAQNGGKLLLDSPITITTATFTSDSTSSIVQNGTSITGGALTIIGNGMVVSGSNNNSLNNVTINGDLNLISGGHEAVIGTLTQDGTTRIGGGGLLYFLGPQATLTGTNAGDALITFADGNGSNQVALDGNVALTLSSTAEILGNTGTVGQAVFNGGNQSITNNGAISATGGGTVNVNLNQGGILNNAGTLEAQSGGTLLMDSPVNGGSITSDNAAGTTVKQNGTTISGSTISVQGAGLVATGSNSNELKNVTVNGNLNLTGGGHEAVVGTLTQDGATRIGGGGLLYFFGPQATLTGTAAGNAVVSFADSNGSNQVALDGNVALTLSSTAEIDGNTGTVGQAVFNGGNQSIANSGAISADGGGTIAINLNQGGALTNGGTLQAAAGSTLDVQSTLANLSGGALTGGNYVAAGTLKLPLNNGAGITTNAANITVSGTGAIINRNSGADALAGFLTTNSGSFTVTGGKTFTAATNLTNNGSVTLGPAGALVDTKNLHADVDRRPERANWRHARLRPIWTDPKRQRPESGRRPECCASSRLRHDGGPELSGRHVSRRRVRQLHER